MPSEASLELKCCPPIMCSCGLAFFQSLASKPMADGSLEGYVSQPKGRVAQISELCRARFVG